MLAHVIANHYRQFSAIAEAWLAAGAATFEIWKNERPLARWPLERAILPHSLIAPILLGRTVVGDLRITGLVDQTARMRLAVDAVIVAQFVELEQELQQMTASLVKSQDQLLGVYDLAQALHGHTRIDSILYCLVYEAQRMLGAQHSFAIILAQGADTTVIQHPEAGFDEALIWKLFWETHISDQALYTHSELEVQLPGEIRNARILPFRLRGKVAGALGLINGRAMFDAADFKLFQAIVDQGSAQLERVMRQNEDSEQTRIQADIERARRVQNSLLPRQSAAANGLDICAISRPVFDVGGDFYILVSRPDRPYIFAVGDVSGKGMAAAMLMTMTRTALYSKASFIPEPTPEVIMRQSNEDLYDDFVQVGMLATVFVGQYDSATRELTYANAGHSPVIYKPHTGAAQLLQADCTALGVLPVSQCRNNTLTLHPGDMLIVGTDGLADTRNEAGERYGHERLLALITRIAARSAREIADSVLAEIEEFATGVSRDDDQTLVVIKGVQP